MSTSSSNSSNQVKRVVLAYSGGLDTSIIIPWLRENYACEVIAMVGNVGQGDDYAAVRRKALASGAVKVFVEDLREEFVTGHLWKAVKAGAIYEGKYLLGTSLARPVLAKAQVRVALEQGADALAHGCTGKGNDQVRFELAYQALAPHLRVIAPWREWSIKSREDALQYAESHGIPVPVTKKDLYSRDQNLWHLSHEGGPLETELGEPPEDAWKLTSSPQKAPEQEGKVVIGFEAGAPVSVNGKRQGPVKLVETLNAIGGQYGVGRTDLVENRLVGMKSHGAYETPGGTLITLPTMNSKRSALTGKRSTTSSMWRCAMPSWSIMDSGSRRCAKRSIVLLRPPSEMYRERLPWAFTAGTSACWTASRLILYTTPALAVS